ncbi:tripartite tricarboxylate transporter TctB family protein [Microbaculum sp. FT89]|uniref:tripartite tricarboxylate transporter TctB family protein n=1 Tax=Microbaculum sp. FT89 TaxID=3447298 RepID=UPI003F539EAA
MAVRFGLVVYLTLILIAVIFWTQLDGLLYPAGVFPRFILVVLAACSVISLIREVAAPKQQPAINKRVIFAFAIAGSTVVYIYAITIIGFYLSSTIYLLLLYPLVNIIKDGAGFSRRLFIGTISTTAIVISGLYIVFTLLLRINVPVLLANGPF